MKLDCPLPKFDFDKISLGHGSGGLLTHRLLQSGVFDILKNDALNQQHDGAILQLEGPLAFSTDSYVVSPRFFPGGSIGDLAINGTVNDLAMCGASASYISLAFILEEGLLMEEFGRILQDIKRAADAAGVQVVTGDTKVVERGKGDGIFINTSGIGKIHPKANIAYQRIEAGDELILSGPLAAHGICIMSLREGLQFETDVCSDTQSLKSAVLNLLDNYGEEIHFLRDATRGGLASVANEVAGLCKLGIEMEQQKIPIDPQVEGACEMLGLDPLYVANEGVFVLLVKGGKGQEIAGHLRQLKGFEKACVIGKIQTEEAGRVWMKSAIGGKRIVNFLPGEQLPRIC